MTELHERMQRYLLGELPEAEQSALEQQYFSDRQLFDQVVSVENELVDGYARGLLAPATRERFEQHYLAHPHRRQRAKFAEALNEKLERTSKLTVAVPIQAETFWSRLTSTLRGPRLAWALPLALLLMVGAAIWFLIESRRLRQEFVRTELERTTLTGRERELQQQLATEQQRAEQLAGELARLRAEQQTVRPTPSPSTAPTTFATLSLTIAGIRSTNSGSPAILVIPPQTEQARLRLNIRELDYPAYSAVLQTAAGSEVFAWSRLSPQTTKIGALLTLTMPTRIVAQGDYILTLRGITRTGEVEDVNKSLLRIERR